MRRRGPLRAAVPPLGPGSRGPHAAVPAARADPAPPGASRRCAAAFRACAFRGRAARPLRPSAGMPAASAGALPSKLEWRWKKLQGRRARPAMATAPPPGRAARPARACPARCRSAPSCCCSCSRLEGKARMGWAGRAAQRRRPGDRRGVAGRAPRSDLDGGQAPGCGGRRAASVCNDDPPGRATRAAPCGGGGGFGMGADATRHQQTKMCTWYRDVRPDRLRNPRDPGHRAMRPEQAFVKRGGRIFVCCSKWLGMEIT